MGRQLDWLDLEILEGLGVCGPRNISNVARDINVPTSTVHERIKDLKTHFSLYMQVNTYHAFLGLKKAFVFAKANPGYEKRLLESMRINKYWLYLTAQYGTPESFYGVYGIPIDYTEEFERLLQEIERLKIAQRINLLWSTSIHTVNLTGNWFDHESHGWVFAWNKWIEDIEKQGTSLPYTLIEPQGYPQKADEIDVIILKELEKDAECKLKDIAGLLKVPTGRVQYHFQNHVIAKGLIEGYTVFFPHFENSDNYCFRFNFYDAKNMAKFAVSIENKPFVRNIAKIIGENALFARVYLPRTEFRNFTDCLLRLIGRGFMKSYDYVIHDLSRWDAQTIPYTLFKDNSWIYNHEEYMKKLHEVAHKKES